MEVFTGSFEFLDGQSLVNFDRREGIVMQAEYLVATNEIRCLRRILDSHGKIIADAQSGKFEGSGLADEFHIHGEGGITGVVEVALTALDDKPAGITTVSAIGQAAGMNGIDHLGSPEIEGKAAAVV